MSGYGGPPLPGGYDPYDPYGGQQQPGWQDPYAQPAGWPQDPHGRPAGWQDPYDPQAGWQQAGYGPVHGYGPPGVPPGGAANGSAIGALICNILALFGVFFCCLGAVASIPGVVLGGMALNRSPSNPESARQLALWSWVCFVLSIVLSIGLLAVFYVLGQSNPTYY
ncbi:hypothetical protein ACRYCC_09370 [Actinomadura scrupuli]|uniref:DUF4190 domain-containing protein n=1 Tax=Actinomadura scrupuli TaxID=559629 RepID=UPI003D95BE66